MRENNISNWKYKEDLDTMLFFAQRMDELLFHHSTDSYRYPVLSIVSLCDEYIQAYEDSEQEIINEKNLDHIMDELLSRIKEDSVVESILTKEYKERFEKNIGSWGKKEKRENILFIKRKLGKRKYYNGVVGLIKNCIKKNTDKRLVDRYAGILIRVLIDEGYNDTYIFNCLHEVFFFNQVDSILSYEDFISKFTFTAKKYDVYLGFSHDLSTLLPLFKKIHAGSINITKVDAVDVPVGIKTKGQKTILKFENVFGLDVFSAYEIVKGISDIIVNAFGYYSHIRSKIKIYGQIIDNSSTPSIITISNHELLKYRVSAMSYEESASNADSMLNVVFSKEVNIDEVNKIATLHNAAVCSDNTSDSLLSLWSIAELISENENGDKIQRVKACLIPFLTSTYIEKIIHTCMMDIDRWNHSFFEDIILKSNPGLNELEATFAFLVLDDQEDNRKKLYSLTETFPLLRNRVFVLNAQLKNTKGYASMIKLHEERIRWQIHRIYRARNYIIHDGRRSNDIYQELVINLHSYIDTMFTKVIHMLMESPYQTDSIEDIVIEHKIKTAIMDDKMSLISKEGLKRETLKQYLYYDFEMSV